MSKSRITNFTMKVVDILLRKAIGSEDRKFVVIEIDGVQGTFMPEEISDAKKFAVKIKSMSPSFSKFGMSSIDLEALMRFVMDKATDIPITYSIYGGGYISDMEIWIFQNGVVKDKKFYEFDENFVADLGSYKVKFSEPNKNIPHYQEDHYYDEDFIKDLEKYFSYIFCGQGQGRLVLGFMVASMFLHHTKTLKPFPILYVDGKPGTGKTTALQFALSLFGVSSTPDNFENIGKFVDEKDLSMIRSMPVWKDEYKNTQRVRAKD